MKQLRAIRILLAVLLLIASAACLIIGPHIHPMARAAHEMQIALSLWSVSLGVIIVWIVITFVLGRVYCASFCPVGVFSDIFFRIRKCVPRFNKPFRYRNPSRFSMPILVVYIICIVAGITIVPILIEPWNIARNMSATANLTEYERTWATFGIGAATGIVAGIVSALLIAITSLWRGREFCSRYCPIGTGLGYLQQYSLFHLEIDPDRCVSCGKCEDNCRSQCIKIADRLVDEKRCVRCFDCVADCPEGAIKYQFNKNMRPASPLMRKADKT